LDGESRHQICIQTAHARFQDAIGVLIAAPVGRQPTGSPGCGALCGPGAVLPLEAAPRRGPIGEAASP